MPRPTARFFTGTIEDDGYGNPRFEVIDQVTVDTNIRRQIGEPYFARLSDFTVSDYYKVIGTYGGNPKTDYPKGKAWCDAFITDAWRSGKPFVVNNGGGYRSERTPTPRPPVSEPIETPKPATGFDLSEIVSIINAAVDTKTAGIAETLEIALTERITDIIAEQVAKAQPTVYQINGKATVEVKGDTHAKFPRILSLAAKGKNIMLVGPAGTGKSFIAKQIAEALGIDYRETAFNNMLPESRIFGYMDMNGKYVRTPFRDAYEYGHLWLGDEADNGNANVIAGTNNAIAGKECAFPDGLVAKHPNFVAMLACNTYGQGANRTYIGRNKLDGATLNRFSKVTLPIDEALEERLTLPRHPNAKRWLEIVRACRANVERYSLEVVISPRDAIDGADTLDGATFEEVANERFLDGLAADVRRKVLDGVDLSE